MTATLLGMKSGLALLDDMELFNRMADRITREHPDVDRAMAGRILDQAIIFVATAGRHPGIGLSPSEQIDIGWDTFILYTREYADFCGRVAGRYIHHTPNDNPAAPATRADGAPILSPAETAAVIRRDGFLVDAVLWPTEAKANCTNCYCGEHEGGEITWP